MSKIDTLIKEVLALDEKATKGPWEADCFDAEGRETQCDIFTEAGDQIATFFKDGEVLNRKENTNLVASYRTSAPILAKALQRVLEEIKQYYVGPLTYERIVESLLEEKKE